MYLKNEQLLRRYSAPMRPCCNYAYNKKKNMFPPRKEEKKEKKN